MCVVDRSTRPMDNIVLLSLFSILLLAAAGGRQANAAAAAQPSSATVYWQTVLPNSPIPSVLQDLFTQPAAEEQKIEKVPIRPRTDEGQKLQKLFFYPKYGARTREEQKLQKLFFYPSYGSRTDEGQKLQKLFFYPKYGARTHEEQKLQKLFFYPSYGSRTHEEQKQQKLEQKLQKLFFYSSYGSRTREEQRQQKLEQKLQKLFFYPSYGSRKHEEQKLQKLFFYPSYGSRTDEEQKESIGRKLGKEHVHMHAHGHGELKLDVFFLEETLTQGSKLNTLFPVPDSVPPLLHRDVANSMPDLSTANLPDILSMYGVESAAAVEEDIKFTLELCEHPDQTGGVKATCATSVDSLVEFPMSVLGTRDIRVSSNSVPKKGAALQQYNITDVRKIAESGGVACHDLTYPYALFYCHTTGPMRAYAATLAGEDGATTVEAVAVCHLDTSHWDPAHQSFEMLHVKPGTVPVCHFLIGRNILWFPGDEQASVVADAAQ